MGESEECICYIIITTSGTYYTGITSNLVRRWREHVSGRSAYLGRYKAKEVVYVECCGSRRLAARLERRIKTKGAYNYLLRLKYRK